MSQPLLRMSTGVAGLDETLHGGLIARRSCLVHGDPGSGKTTLGQHFLSVGAVLGEKTLFITLEESEEHIRLDAKQRGIDIRQVEILDISPTSQFFIEMQN